MYIIPKTNIWGPLFWYVIHIVAFNYPNNPTDLHKMMYKNFFESFANVLPCKKCREHYQSHLSRYPISPFLDNNILLNKWVIDLHNIVNKSLNKRLYNYQEVYNIYNNLIPISPFSTFIEKNKKITKYKYNSLLKNKHYFILILLILIVIYLLYLKNKYYYIY